MKKTHNIYALYFLLILFCSCATTAQISQKQAITFLNDSVINTGHVGISIYEPATQKYLYNYNAEKNFLPSSNVKLFTLYAGLKYLGDSIAGINYSENDTAILLYPSADPTLLHADFTTQPLIDFLQKTNKKIVVVDVAFKAKPYGNGWAWNDYPDYYMAERSALPIYGNTVTFMLGKNNFKSVPSRIFPFIATKDSLQNFKTNYVARDFFSNTFSVELNNKNNETILTPFITSTHIAAAFLEDSLHKNITVQKPNLLHNAVAIKTIYSRPVDSLFKPMMFNSDNFFAEQTLLMVSNKKLGYMSDEDMIDSLLKNDFKDIPTKIRWVDGCGLSRYNLFSPKDFIYILDKLQKEFGMDRMKRILTTGGQGTLTGYYQKEAGLIYAKSGSMSNNVSLSGYLTTKKNKQLLFSIQLNSFSGSGKQGRRAIEKFILAVIENN